MLSNWFSQSNNNVQSPPSPSSNENDGPPLLSPSHSQSSLLNSNSSNNNNDYVCFEMNDNTKWVIRNYAENILDDKFFDSQVDCCRYIQRFICENKLVDLDCKYTIESYCILDSGDIFEFKTMDDVYAYLSTNNDIDVVYYKVYKRNKMFFAINYEELDEIYIVQRIHRFNKSN